MTMPGFTAEQGLKQRQGSYLLRSISWPVEGAGQVCPQLRAGPAGWPDWVCDFIWECCFEGNFACCWAWMFKCAGSVAVGTLAAQGY